MLHYELMGYCGGVVPLVHRYPVEAGVLFEVHLKCENLAARDLLRLLELLLALDGAFHG